MPRPSPVWTRLRARGARKARKRSRVSIASWVALLVVVGSLAAYAIRAQGEPVHHADLNDGGVWVSSQVYDALQRENLPIRQPDAQIAGSTGDAPDVLQDGSAVVQVGSGGVLTPVSTTRGVALTDSAVNVVGAPVLEGGTVATVDPDSGAVWAQRVDPGLGVSSLSGLDSNADPLTRVGADASLVATDDGTVLAASAQKRTLTTLAPLGRGFARPAVAKLPKEPRGGIIAMTSVGDRPVLLDGASEVLSGSTSAKLAGSHFALQQPGPAAGGVLVGTDDGLEQVDLGSGHVTRVAGVSGIPAAPVRVGACAFGAWDDNGTGHVVLDCDGQKPQTSPAMTLGPDAKLVFRVNRNQVLLNDVHNGDVWLLDSAQPVQIANWQSLSPTTPDKNSQQQQKNVNAPDVKQPPQAVKDDLGARPGRTTVLHVLDNDLVSGGGILSVVGVDAPKDPGIQVQPAPDRESVLLTLAPTVQKDFGFRYTVSDGTGGKDSTADGDVTVHVRTDPGSAQPVVRANAAPPPTYPLTQGDALEVPVVDDWRDPTYGDPVSLDDVQPAAGADATVTPDGLVRVIGTKAGLVKVPYDVSTGGQKATGALTLKVLPHDSTKPVAPIAEPDVVAGQVGGAIVVHPLDNDVPGADPTDAGARLELAGKVAPNSGLQVDTDLAAGTVTVRAQRAGSYTLQYAAGFGAAPRSTSQIRVNVDPASTGDDAPIATPDQTTVRGTSPMTVDVLANDYDPQGRLLAVTHAAPTDPSSPLEVAVLDGHWLRINATTTGMVPKTQAISYTVSNGAQSATGTVTVTQKDPLPSQANHPIAGPDSAVVRSGDTAVVPVLDNDSTPSGDPVGLRVPEPAGLVPGQLPVEEGVGKAYVSGNNVRYVAPVVTSPTTVHVDYTVENTADPQRPESAGVLTLDITPPPTDQNPNRPPTPREIDARTVEGDTVALRLPLVGNDPDGDSVSITGVSSAPQLGRILGFGATTLTYQSFPGSTGTDEFGYTVTDKYGATAQGTVRVAVVPPGAPQAPVAVNDAVTADLGRQVDVDVLANDLRTPGTAVSIEPLTGTSAKLLSPTGPIRVVASQNPKQPVVVTYRVTNGLADSVGELTVTSIKGYDNPPVVPDVFAQPKPGSGSTTVDVLAKADDIDGEGAPLKVTSVGDPRATIGARGKVTLPVLDVPQVVPFEVTDTGGATAAAAIYVPARPSGAPYLKPGASIGLNPGETKDVPLSDIVADPENDHVILTLADRIVASPDGILTAGAPNGKDDVLHLTAGDKAGPAAVTFEVSDRPDLTDPAAHHVTLTVPVQIGSTASKLTCPDDPLTVYTGGFTKVVDIASVCHVWTPDPSQAASLRFAATWKAPLQGVSVTNAANGIQLRAGVDAIAGSGGTLEVGAAGKKPTAELHVQVLAAPPPSMNGITLQTEAGKPVSVDVAKYATSPFGKDARWALTRAPSQTAGPVPTQVSVAGTKLTITPPAGAKSFGSYTYNVTLSDDGNAPGSNRPAASADITLTVVAPPSQPANVHSDGQTYDARVVLLWTPPAANGGTISGYTVSWSGGSQQCASSPCSIAGLRNGTDYAFTVVAHNQYGDSEPSAPGTGKPDRVPDAVTNLAVARQEDKAVTLTWSDPARLDYSPIQQFLISYPGGGVASVPASQHTFTATGLTNGENVAFSVWAQNAAGPADQKASVTGMGAGKPAAPDQPKAATSDVAGGTQKAATITWSAVGANGPDPVTYQVTRTGGGAGTKVLCPWQETTSCLDTLGTDGTKYSYTVQARNAEATAPRETDPSLHVSGASPAVTVEAASPPETPQITSLGPTGSSGAAKMTVDVGASHGSTNQVQCQPGCNPATTTVPNGGQNGVAFNIGGLSDGTATTVQVRACNGSSGTTQTGAACSAWVQRSVTAYGPIGTPTLSVSHSGQTFNWSYSGDAGGRPVKVTLTMGGTTIDSMTTGNRGFSNSGSKTVGYSTTETFTLTVADSTSTPNGARPSKTTSKSDTTDPPPVTVTVSHGSACGGGGGSACDGQAGACIDPSCAYIHLTLKGFTSTQNCIASSNATGGPPFTTHSFGPNFSGDTTWFFGYSGKKVWVDCGSVQSNILTW